MSNLIVYFHGFNSNSKCFKAKLLKKNFPNERVISYDIDIYPSISIPKLKEDISLIDLDEINSEGKLICIGSSLGGWYASKIATIFDCHAILINPVFKPWKTLKKFNVYKNILNEYKSFGELIPRKYKDVYFFGIHDDIIHYKDNSKLLRKTECTSILLNDNHEFLNNMNIVINYLKKILILKNSMDNDDDGDYLLELSLCLHCCC